MNAIQTLIEQVRQQGDPVLAGQAALELVETREVLARLLEDYWRPVTLDDRQWAALSPGDVICRYCGQAADIAIHIPHLPDCVVPRARALLK